MFKRILSLVLTLAVLLSALPAQADSLTPLSAGEIQAARALAAMDGEYPAWQKGMAPSSGMNALQVQQYLEWLLSDEVGGLMNEILDSAQLLELAQTGAGASLSAVSGTLQQLRNRLAFYRDELEQGRLSIYNDLNQLGTAGLTERAKLRLALRVREDVAQLQSIIETVARYYDQYHDLLEEHELNLASRFDAADSPAGVLSGAAADKLLAAADKLTDDEQKNVSAMNGVDFSVIALSSKQFGFIVRDADGKPIEKANVSVACASQPTLNDSAETDENGLATFLVKDFNPNENNKVTVSVIVMKDNFYCIREMRATTLRGGSTETVRLDAYAGNPFLRMACYNGADMLSQQNSIFYTPKNDATQQFEILVDNFGKKKISGWLYLCYQTYDAAGNVVDTEERRSFTSGTSVTFAGAYCSKIVPGTTVSVRVETPSFNQTYATQMKIEKAVVEEPVFKNTQAINFTSGGLSFTFPSSIPFIGGSKMSLDLPFLTGQLAIDPSGYIQFAYGRNFQSEELSWKSESLKDTQQRMDDADKRAQRDANAVDNRVYKNAGATAQIKFLGNVTAAVTVFAGLQGRIKEDASYFRLTGAGGVQAAFKGGYGWQFLVGGMIPMFAALDFTFALGASFALALEAKSDLSSPKFIFGKGQGLTIDILAELGVSAGMGVRGMLNVALRFFGNIAPKLRLTDPVSAAVTLAMGLEVTAQAFVAKWKQTLWKGTYSADSNADSLASSGAGAENSAVLTQIEAGVNTPSSLNTLLPVKNGAGLAADKEEEVFSRLDSLSQEIQYVTLTTPDGKSSATFGFWITPVTDKGDRKAELVWYNLDAPARHGLVLPDSGDNWRTSVATDYAFAIAGHGDVVGVNVLSGLFGTREDQKPYASRMSLAVMQAVKTSDGTLALEINNAAGHYLSQAASESGGSETGGRVDYGYTLSMPIIYFINSAPASSETNQWFLTASCSREDLPTGKTHHIYSLDLQRTTKGVEMGVQVKDDPERGVYTSDPQKITRCLAAAQPTNKKLDGTSAKEGDSLSCYYRLSVTEENRSAMKEKTSLYIHLNQSRQLLDENVVFFAPLVRYGAISDGWEFLFYLKKGQADDGSDCYRLMGASRIGNANFTIRDYDVPLYAEHFKITTVNDGEDGITYLYWTECVAPSNEYQSEEKYQVKCVRFDHSSNSMSAPFTLVELSQMPSSLHLMMDGTGYYTTELPAGEGQSASSAAVSQQLVRFTFSLQTAVSLTGVVSYDPCVCAGEYATLLFSVENTGNLPVSRFMVSILEQGATEPLQNIIVDCRDPLSSSTNSLFGSAADSAYSVSRVDGIFDDLNGDNWIIRSAAPDSNAEVVEQLHTDLLMPGGVHTYQASFKVPDDWNGEKKLTAELGRLFALTHYSNALTGNADALADEVVFEADGTLVNANGVPLPPENALGTGSTIGVKRGAVGTAELSKDIDVGRGDLMLDCQPYVDSTGAQFVRVSIVGRSETAGTTLPTLTAKLGDTPVFSYRFANPVDEDFGYTLDIPVEMLLGARSYGEITFTLSDNAGENDASREFASFDNERTVTFGQALYIVRQPESVSVVEGEDAVFTIVVSGGVPPYKYQWQRLNASGVWEDIVGANGAQLIIPSVTLLDNGASFRCVVTDSAGNTVISGVATLSNANGGATLTVWAEFPVTGDRAHPLLWALGALACALCAWLLLRRRKGRDA